MIHLDELLTQLAPRLNIESLAPDEKGCCLLTFPPDEFQVQLEVEEPSNETLLITSILGELPVGAYREELLKAALVANGKAYPRHGTLAFSNNNESLILFEKLPEQGLNGDQVYVYLQKFMTKGRTWRDALQNGDIPHEIITGGPESGGGIFGLRP